MTSRFVLVFTDRLTATHVRIIGGGRRRVRRVLMHHAARAALSGRIPAGYAKWSVNAVMREYVYMWHIFLLVCTNMHSQVNTVVIVTRRSRTSHFWECKSRIADILRREIGRKTWLAKVILEYVLCRFIIMVGLLSQAPAQCERSQWSANHCIFLFTYLNLMKLLGL